eukprot:1027626-Rhodomonas_salina.1
MLFILPRCEERCKICPQPSARQGSIYSVVVQDTCAVSRCDRVERNIRLRAAGFVHGCCEPGDAGDC